MLLAYGAIQLISVDGAGQPRRLFPWEFVVIVQLAFAALLTANFYRLAFRKASVIEILPNSIHHTSWKKPIDFTAIAEIIVKLPSQKEGRKDTELWLRLTDGKMQLIPSALIQQGPRTFAKRLRQAIAECGVAPLS